LSEKIDKWRSYDDKFFDTELECKKYEFKEGCTDIFSWKLDHGCNENDVYHRKEHIRVMLEHAAQVIPILKQYQKNKEAYNG